MTAAADTNQIRHLPNLTDSATFDHVNFSAPSSCCNVIS